jgi:hypothetical protein
MWGFSCLQSTGATAYSVHLISLDLTALAVFGGANIGKGKVLCTLWHVWIGDRVAPSSLNVGTRWMCLVSFTSRVRRPRYTLQRWLISFRTGEHFGQENNIIYLPGIDTWVLGFPTYTLDIIDWVIISASNVCWGRNFVEHRAMSCDFLSYGARFCPLSRSKTNTHWDLRFGGRGVLD